MSTAPNEPVADQGHGWFSSVVFFVALLSTALALGGALAHLYELPNKIGLPQDRYFIVQNIYRGWWRLAYLLGIQLLSMLALIVLTRGQPSVVWPAVVALACLISAQVVFWGYTYPANVATGNWTTQPENWEALRRQWEYSHAVGAVFQILAMSALIVAALARERLLRPAAGGGKREGAQRFRPFC